MLPIVVYFASRVLSRQLNLLGRYAQLTIYWWARIRFATLLTEKFIPVHRWLNKCYNHILTVRITDIHFVLKCLHKM